ncbi:MAG: Serine-type D-Ala-D-Ala carboxypeptidase [Candidatus Saccharibacteria bacterium]|nr:Serine-type D-Ala-D-Ala carboxypeptidase [Candidatus Saccharibacteria bacterium]
MKKHRTRFGIGLLIVIVVVLAIVFTQTASAPEKPTVTKPASGTTTTPANPPPASFDKKQYSNDDPASLWLVVNKLRPLNPKDYAPADLVVPNIPLRSNITSTEKYVRAATAKALETMVAAAAAQGVNLNLQSGYRSYSFQVTLYNDYVSSQGQSVADSQSARPGYSEHQSGLAADLGGTTQPSCNVDPCFADTVEGKWLAANAHSYGFIIRYPKDGQAKTGYIYEPWHVRYVGTALSEELHRQGDPTLEEFFGLPLAPDYQ